jgi:hypothetical protein
MPTKFTGVHRAHAAFATRSRSFSSGTSAAAPLKPTAPANDPPNHIPRPRSCRLRTTVWRSDMPETTSS